MPRNYARKFLFLPHMSTSHNGYCSGVQDFVKLLGDVINAETVLKGQVKLVVLHVCFSFCLVLAALPYDVYLETGHIC